MSLGEKVKIARENVGLTQPALGKIIGKTKQAISLIEKDDFSSVERIKSTLILLAKALNSNFGESWLDEYLDGNQAMPSKREIIEKATPEEIVGIKYGGGATVRRSKSEIERLRNLLNKKLKEMENEDGE